MYLKISAYQLLSLGFMVFGQQVVSSQISPAIGGKIIDDNNKPVPHITILLEGPVIKWTSSNETGDFEFLNIPIGKYTITVSGIGYQDEQISLTLTTKRHQELEILLKESITELDMVTVTSESTTTEQARKGYEIATISVKNLQTQSIEPNRILEQVSGVKVRQQGGLGSRSNFFINGLGDNAVRFYIDGIPMEHMGSSYSLNTIPISLIDRIDVYKGVVPIALGNDALGGAINIVTKRSLDNVTELSYSYGSFNTHRAAIFGNYRLAKSGLSFKVSAFFNRSDNNYKVWGDDIYITDPETFEITRDIEVKRFHDAFESRTIRTDIGFSDKKWADQFFIGLLLSGMDKEIQHGATMEVPFGEATYDQNVAMPYLNYQKNDLFTEGLDVSFFSSWSKLERNRHDISENIYNWYGEIEGTRTLGGEQQRTLSTLEEEVFLNRLNLRYTWNDWLSLGFNGLVTDLERTDDDPLINILQKTDGYYAPQNFAKHVFGLGVQGEWFNQKLNATLFGKSFHYKADIRLSEYDNGVETFESVDSSNSDFAYGIASSYQLLPWLRVNSSLEAAIRLPEANEILGDGLIIENNPSLQPETSDNINLGVNLSLLNGSSSNLTISCTGFYRMVNNRIQQTQSTSNESLFAYQNIEEVLMRGIDAKLNYDHNGWWNFNQTISWLNPIIKTEKDIFGNDNILYNTRLSNIPFFQANSTLRVSPLRKKALDTNNDLSFYWIFGYVGDFYRNSEEIGEFGRDKIPEQFVHSAGAGYTFLQNTLSVSIDINNIFNHQLFDDFAIQKPGRAGYIKLTYQISKKR